MTVKEFLSQANILDKAIDAKQEQILSLRNVGKTSSGIITIQGNLTKNSSVERTVEKIFSMEQELNEEIDNLVDKKAEISKFIKKLDDIALETMMEYHYLCGLTWEEVAEKMFISIRQLYNWRNKAISVLEQHYNHSITA